MTDRWNRRRQFHATEQPPLVRQLSFFILVDLVSYRILNFAREANRHHSGVHCRKDGDLRRWFHLLARHQYPQCQIMFYSQRSSHRICCLDVKVRGKLILQERLQVHRTYSMSPKLRQLLVRTGRQPQQRLFWQGHVGHGCSER